ncbi:hypothetical protein F4779DRAFT_566103 [Xylariaceae sp. FL0662B]|nr:hypothetical protein F4779DRAFT_566103 [Xylariaceae sp. FL0662B]
MALAAVYKQFLATPSTSHLADEATIHYITTTTSYKGSAALLKHLSTSRNQFKKKKEDFISITEGQNAIAVEVDTVLEFVTSGGPYLPALDDNFIADRTVYLPIIHIVAFNSDNKILQIRQSWDQGSLLKQLDVIGKTGHNWPIRDSREQIKLIETSVKSSGGTDANHGTSDVAIRSRGNSTNILRDPHASLSLFAPREESDQSISAVISPRGGARPRQRDFAEILGDEPVSPIASRDRSESPSKAVAPKAGAAKKFQPSRLFENDEASEGSPSPEVVASSNRFYQPNPKKYSHFDFADGSEPQDVPQPGEQTFQKTKHSSQWSFDDFVTPQKAKPTKTIRHQDVRHWGTEDDQPQESPMRKPAPSKPRRDAETHFEFVDDGTPKGEPRAGRPRGTTQNTGLGLYKNNLFDEEGDSAVPADEPRPLGTITNLKDRGRDFESHWDITDNSPGQKSQSKPLVGEDRKKVVKMMDANWKLEDQSPTQKENKPVAPQNGSKASGERGIHIAGDGMGGGKGSNRNWLFGDDDEDTKSVPGRKPGAAKSGGFNWDF